jgi:hypothetical protein
MFDRSRLISFDMNRKADFQKKARLKAVSTNPWTINIKKIPRIDERSIAQIVREINRSKY